MPRNRDATRHSIRCVAASGACSLHFDKGCFELQEYCHLLFDLEKLARQLVRKVVTRVGLVVSDQEVSYLAKCETNIFQSLNVAQTSERSGGVVLVGVVLAPLTCDCENLQLLVVANCVAREA